MADTRPVAHLARLAPLLAGALGLLVYLLTMPPGLTWDLGGPDGGELATGVYTLGLVHSPGYPTYLLLAQPATLLPVQSPAHRLNILSAICATGAIALLAWTTARAVDRNNVPRWGAPLVGGLAGLLFGLSEVVWSQAIITEVYALAGLFCVVLLAMTFWIERAPTDGLFTWRLALLGLTVGVGMGSHYMVVYMALFAVVYLFLRARARVLRPASLLALSGFALGLGVFAYLPLRAGAVPISNWGNPNTLERFGWVVRGAAYSNRVRLAPSPRRLAALVRALVTWLSVPGIALGLLGLSLWWDTRRSLLYSVLITVGLNFWLMAGYYSADTLPYIYPSLVLLALAAGSAAHFLLFEWLPDQTDARRRGRVLVYVGLVAVVLGPLLVRGARVTGQATTWADDYSRRVVEGAMPNTLIISNQDTHTFAVRYAAAVSVGRPDVVLLDVRLLQFDWFRTDLARFYPQLGLDPTVMAASDDFGLLDLLALIPPDVPVTFTYPADLPAGYQLAADDDGAIYTLVERPPISFELSGQSQ